MRSFIMLLIQLPPDDGDTTQVSPYQPEPGRTTQPMLSPYRPLPSNAPPPPPQRARSDDRQPWPVTPREAKRATRPPRRSGGGFAVGVMAALLIIALAGAGVALAAGKLPGVQHLLASALSGGTTQNTPTPSATTPAATATTPAAPTVTPVSTLGPQMLPPPPLGFTSYQEPSGLWALNIPVGIPVKQDQATTPVGEVPETIFSETSSTPFTVYDLPAPISASEEQAVFDAVAQSVGATDIVILDQGSTTYGANTWQELHVRATVNNVRIEAILLYTTHDEATTVVSMIAPALTFGVSNQILFEPMITSFSYLV